jgi:hypothetical protein
MSPSYIANVDERDLPARGVLQIAGTYEYERFLLRPAERSPIRAITRYDEEAEACSMMQVVRPITTI